MLEPPAGPRHLPHMKSKRVSDLDMTLDGSFRPSPGRAGLPWPVKIGVAAALIGALAVSFAVAALAVWLFTLLLPVVVIAAVVAWGAFRFQAWRARRSATGGRGLFRP